MDLKNVMYRGTPCIWTWKMWCIVGHPVYGHEKCDETPWNFASSSRIHNLSPLLKISKLKTSISSNFYKNKCPLILESTNLYKWSKNLNNNILNYKSSKLGVL